MKKLVAMLLIVCLLLAGCASGVDQAEYDALADELDQIESDLEELEEELEEVIAERDALQAELDALQGTDSKAGSTTSDNMSENAPAPDEPVSVPEDVPVVEVPAQGSGSSSAADDVYAEAEADRSLRIGIATPITTHNPYTSPNYIQQHTVFESLVMQTPESLEVVPCLAKEWVYISETSLRVFLRDDVYFTDGQHMTAYDVLCSYRDFWAVSNMAQYFACYDWDATEIIDDFTIEFAFTQPYGPALTQMASWYIFCAEDMPYGSNPADDDKWVSAPNGTGPYYCLENITGNRASYALKSPEDYWGELPECTDVTYVFYAEAAMRHMDFETGALDVACNISPRDATYVLNGDTPSFTRYYISDQTGNMLIVLPEETALFDDIRVREAFFKAIDRENIAIATYSALFLPADSILPESAQFHASQADLLPRYDPLGAKELLAEAGYPDGITMRLIVPQHLGTLAEAIQASLAAANIFITIECYDIPTAIPLILGMESDFVCMQTSLTTLIEPTQLIANFGPSSTMAAAGMQDPVWEDAFNRAHYSLDIRARADAFRELQTWAASEFRILPICTPTTMTLFNSEKLEAFQYGLAPYAQFAIFN